MTNRTRLAYLVSQYPAISHTFILREVLALREFGLDISVASINPPDRPSGNLTEEERQEARRTFCVKRVSALGILAAHLRTLIVEPLRYFSALLFALQLGQFDLQRIAYGFFYFVEAVLVSRWMQRSGHTHLHVHFATPAAMVGLIVSRLSGCSMSITVHGPDEFYDVTQYQLAPKISGCSFLCVISQFARSQLMKLSSVDQWNKFEVCPLGVDPTKFSPRPQPEGKPIFEVLCVGRLVPAKGQHILIRSIAALAAENCDVNVRFVGNGPDMDSLQKLAQQLGVADRTHFEGAVNQDQIREFYRRASAFVLPSFAEGVPVVLMEAMSMQIPCIATRITGIPELIRDGVDGLLVAPSDQRELASAIRLLMREPGLCRALGEAGRQRVQSCYDLQTNTRRLAETFHRRLEAH